MGNKRNQKCRVPTKLMLKRRALQLHANAMKGREMVDAVETLGKANQLQGSQSKMNCGNNKQETISNDLEPKHIEANIESTDDIREKDDESGSEIRCQTPVNEELWVVRRLLCRCCHSDGAFWSLQTTTEGVAYGDLLQKYFNIELCPVSRDENALSAICALCAARLREARAFYAQARAAEERFTRLYKQNRVRVLAIEEVVTEDVTTVKNEDDDFERTDVGEPDTLNPNLDEEVCTKKSILFTLLNNETTKEPRHNSRKPTPKKLIPKQVVNDEGTRTSKIINEAIPKEVVIEEDTPKTINEVIPEEVVIEEGTPKTINEVDDIESSDDGAAGDCGEPQTDKPNDDHEVSADKLAQNTINCDTTHEGGDKPAAKQLNVSPDYEHTRGGFTCTRCGNLYNTLHSIGCHVKRHWQHSKNKTKKPFRLSPSDYKQIKDIYKCTRCDSQYNIYRQMQQHLKNTHLKVPRYSCSTCGKTFNTVGPFTKHKFEEHSIDDRIKCNACDWFTYKSNDHLGRHKKVFHMLGEKLNCPDCDYFSYSTAGMKRHVIKHSTNKNHHCKYCKKSFLRKNTLTEHERIHTGDKRKVCNVCGQAFVQRASLTYHMAKHHPEVRF